MMKTKETYISKYVIHNFRIRLNDFCILDQQTSPKYTRGHVKLYPALGKNLQYTTFNKNIAK